MHKLTPPTVALQACPGAGTAGFEPSPELRRVSSRMDVTRFAPGVPVPLNVRAASWRVCVRSWTCLFDASSHRGDSISPRAQAMPAKKGRAREGERGAPLRADRRA